MTSSIKKDKGLLIYDQRGGTFVEFSITIAFLLVLIQASVTLCEKIALKTWMENASYQMVFSSSQVPVSSLSNDLSSKRALLFGIFNDPSKKFWKLGPFKSTAAHSSNEGSNYAHHDNSDPNYPDVGWTSDSTGLLNLGINGTTMSAWSGYGQSFSTTAVHPLTGSQGYSSEYEVPQNSEVGGDDIVFYCGTSGLGQCTECTGTDCTSNETVF